MNGDGKLTETENVIFT